MKYTHKDCGGEIYNVTDCARWARIMKINNYGIVNECIDSDLRPGDSRLVCEDCDEEVCDDDIVQEED